MRINENEFLLTILDPYQNVKEIFTRLKNKNLKYAKDLYQLGLNEEERESDGVLTLAGIIKNHEIDEFELLISTLDKLLGKYPIFNNNGFANKLQDSIFDAFSEIEVYNELNKKNKGTIIINPKIYEGEEKNLDFRIHPFDRDIFVEVITPKMSKAFAKNFNPQSTDFIAERNRIFKKAIEEIKKHFPDGGFGFTSPLVIIVNCKFLHSLEYGDVKSQLYKYPIISGIFCYNKIYPIYKNFYRSDSSSLIEEEVEYFTTLFEST